MDEDLDQDLIDEGRPFQASDQAKRHLGSGDIIEAVRGKLCYERSEISSKPASNNKFNAVQFKKRIFINQIQ